MIAREDVRSMGLVRVGRRRALPGRSLLDRPGRAGTAESGEVEPVEFHDHAPGRDEVRGELGAGVLAGVDLRDGP